MAKLSSINKNNKRIKLSDRFFNKRSKLKKVVMDKKIPLEERFKAQQKLSKLPRNSAKIRVMNRCQITGRPHGVYRKLKISRLNISKSIFNDFFPKGPSIFKIFPATATLTFSGIEIFILPILDILKNLTNYFTTHFLFSCI